MNIPPRIFPPICSRRAARRTLALLSISNYARHEALATWKPPPSASPLLDERVSGAFILEPARRPRKTVFGYTSSSNNNRSIPKYLTKNYATIYGEGNYSRFTTRQNESAAGPGPKLVKRFKGALNEAAPISSGTREHRCRPSPIKLYLSNYFGKHIN